MNRGTLLVRLTGWMGGMLLLLGFTAGVVVLMLWLGGKFSPKVPATAAAGQSRIRQSPGWQPCECISSGVPYSESAVGTIRAVHETTIGSKLLARVVEVNLKAGQKVQAGDVLVRLDDTDLRAKLQQAKAAVASIEAVRAQAAADERRYAELVQSRASAGRNTRRRSRHCDPPRPTCCERRRPSTKSRRRWIGPPSALPSTAPSSTRRSTWATWSRRARCWSRSSIPSGCNWWPACASR